MGKDEAKYIAHTKSFITDKKATTWNPVPAISHAFLPQLAATATVHKMCPTISPWHPVKTQLGDVSSSTQANFRSHCFRAC